MGDISFGFQAAAADAGRQSDAVLYRDLIDDCALGHELGYDAAWLLEHHFSDYYPTPSPLLLMAHIAARLPELSLGTSVLVLPWYHPLRLAEEIAMLNSLTRGTLHLGIGRGTAKMEYDAYNIDMNEGRARFAEVFEIVEKGLAGGAFTYRGRFWTIARPIRLRPEPVAKPVRFYGALGSPASAEVMGDLGVPPICLSTFPDGLLAKILARWRARAGARADGAILPISVKMFIADSDAEARELGRRYYPAYFSLQADHYEADADPWAGIPEYADFSRMFANLRKMADPAELDPFLDSNLVGSPATICRRIEALAALGFNYFLVSSATPGTPRAVRRQMMTRFAEEICPRYSRTMRRG
ncbi:MAG TPA: LLM class flavin-dependent oxidoreductase [Candidatus Sulfotelmatobacter sp.]|nr:LLM class flavin-dependent oxidoreductase [Candidatus Sulfotelmatobacter sp.]